MQKQDGSASRQHKNSILDKINNSYPNKMINAKYGTINLMTQHKWEKFKPNSLSKNKYKNKLKKQQVNKIKRVPKKCRPI